MAVEISKNQEVQSEAAIAAIATPLGEGGVAVIRISGKEALIVASRVFKLAKGDILSIEANRVRYGEIISNEGKTLDTGLITVFRSPKSYTGEDTAEISCHGGVLSVRGILREILHAGARMAEPGEFTKRAFLNGKLSLTQAEAVSDMITAKSGQALKAARGGINGALAEKLDKISEELLRLSGGVAAWIDYPEEDIEEIERKSLAEGLKTLASRLEILIAGFDTGKLLREGVKTAIVGKPNVGKSSLMNLLSGYEKSIVTSIAGTTRDVVEEQVSIDGVMLRLCDTAGLCETEDTVEKIGIIRAEKLIENADLLLAVFDISSEITQEDERLLKACRVFNTKVIYLLNKSDVVGMDTDSKKREQEWIKAITERNNADGFGKEISILAMSAINGDGVNELKQAILKTIGLDKIDAESGILANERQFVLAEKAKEEIDEAITAIEVGVTLDAVEVLLEEASTALLTLSGKRVTEAVVDQIFSKFCVGK